MGTDIRNRWGYLSCNKGPSSRARRRAGGKRSLLVERRSVSHACLDCEHAAGGGCILGVNLPLRPLDAYLVKDRREIRTERWVRLRSRTPRLPKLFGSFERPLDERQYDRQITRHVVGVVSQESVCDASNRGPKLWNWWVQISWRQKGNWRPRPFHATSPLYESPPPQLKLSTR